MSEVEYEGSDSEPSEGSGSQTRSRSSPRLLAGVSDSSSSDFAYPKVTPSDSLATQSRPMRDEGLMRSWKLFESILDKKIDALRLDVFSNSTPLPPPLLSADASDALAASIVHALKDGLPDRFPSGVLSPETSNEGPSSELLAAVHEAQSVLSDLSRQNADSMRTIVSMLQSSKKVANAEQELSTNLGSQATAIPDARTMDAIQATLEALVAQM